MSVHGPRRADSRSVAKGISSMFLKGIKTLLRQLHKTTGRSWSSITLHHTLTEKGGLLLVGLA